MITQALNEIVKDGKAPGMIAAIISSEGVLATGSAGVRKSGSGNAFTTKKQINHGAITELGRIGIQTNPIVQKPLDQPEEFTVMLKIGQNLYPFN